MPVAGNPPPPPSARRGVLREDAIDRRERHTTAAMPAREAASTAGNARKRRGERDTDGKPVESARQGSPPCDAEHAAGGFRRRAHGEMVAGKRRSPSSMVRPPSASARRRPPMSKWSRDESGGWCDACWIFTLLLYLVLLFLSLKILVDFCMRTI
jgi:hypothetical protein